MGLSKDEGFWDRLNYEKFVDSGIDFNTASIASSMTPDGFIIKTELMSYLWATVMLDPIFKSYSIKVAQDMMDKQKWGDDEQIKYGGGLIKEFQRQYFAANIKDIESRLNSELINAKISQMMVDEVLGKIHNNFTMCPYGENDIKEFERRIDGARAILSNYLNVDSSSISFAINCENTLTDLLSSIKVNKGDEIIISTDEYDGIIDVVNGRPYHKNSTWPRGSEEIWANGVISYGIIKGLDIKVVDVNNLLEGLSKNISKKTKAVILSHITHETCTELPIESVAGIIKNSGAYFFLDIAQSLGQIEIDLSKIKPDAAFGSGQKWLRGLNTSNIVYVGERLSDYFNLDVCYLGRAKRDHDFRVYYEHDGEGNLINLLSLSQSVNLLEEIGWKNSINRIRYLGDYARDVFSGNEYVEMIESRKPAPGMIPLKIKGAAQKEVQGILKKMYNVNVTYKDKKDILRVSTSQFNTTHEIDILDTALYNIGKYGEDAIKH